MMPRLPFSISRRLRLAILIVCVALVVEVRWHIHDAKVPRPSKPLDFPFQTGCREPDTSAPRQNAAIVMLARNQDLQEAVYAIQSLENTFNRWFHYPIVFLNDKPWDKTFVDALTQTASGEVVFETVSSEAWGFPKWMDVSKARQSIKDQGKKGLYGAGVESYHHMCRFYSGKFYDHPALKKYKWFWRVEPGVEFTCALTYDPFVAMARSGKRYGFTIALWEVGKTSPSLFRAVSDFRRSYAGHIKTSGLWKSMIDASWAPWPLRSWLANIIPHRDHNGDAWNFCHYWSNFEIADLDFFRSKEYRDFFDYLDKNGGFYFERWGDAPVHSLAAALFLDPSEVHHFEDIGYRHDPFYISPANAKGKQLPRSSVLGSAKWADEEEGGVGCRCQTPKRQNFPNDCIASLKQGTV